jgi:cobalt-zinc-cadmium efflux system outer membrane protein
LEQDVALEAANAYAEYVASRDIVETIETRMLTPATDVRATTEYAYRRGEATFVEFLDAVRAYNDTMQSYNEARASFARSLYTLDTIAARVTP